MAGPVDQKYNEKIEEAEKLARTIMGAGYEPCSSVIEYMKAIHHYYSSLLAVLPGNVYWMDKENVCLGSNDNQLRKAHLPPSETLVGLRNSDSKLSWCREADVIDANNLRVMKTGLPYEGEEEVFMDGKMATYVSQKVPVMNKKDECIGLVGVSFDITDRKIMEKKLRNNLEETRNFCHDARTSLSALVQTTELLSSFDLAEEKEKVKEIMGWMQAASRELLSLFDGAMENIVMNETSKAPLKKEPFSLKILLDRLRGLILPAAKNKQLELFIHCDDSLCGMYQGDLDKLCRVLLNLLSNAVKYTFSGSVTLSVEKSVTKHQKPCLLFIVKDTGVGISEEDKQYLFDEFYRVKSSDHEQKNGLGLGLALVKKHIDLMGGDVDVESCVGKGSTFRCFIPLEPVAE
ncbi:MAG: PAS domain-containing sensor histidine kinase [Gammaproteobacteria bacterium]